MAGRVTVNNIDAYEGACLGGLGIIQAPLVGMRVHLREGRLLRLLDDWVAAPMPVTMIPTIIRVHTSPVAGPRSSGVVRSAMSDRYAVPATKVAIPSSKKKTKAAKTFSGVGASASQRTTHGESTRIMPVNVNPSAI